MTKHQYSVYFALIAMSVSIILLGIQNLKPKPEPWHGINTYTPFVFACSGEWSEEYCKKIFDKVVEDQMLKDMSKVIADRVNQLIDGELPIQTQFDKKNQCIDEVFKMLEQREKMKI